MAGMGVQEVGAGGGHPLPWWWSGGITPGKFLNI